MTELSNYTEIYKENQSKNTMELILNIKSALSILRQDRAVRDPALEQYYINKAYKYISLAGEIYSKFYYHKPKT